MKQYKVGDKVTIRVWESMEREFGDCRDVPGGFVDAMRKTCGTVAKITDVFDGDIYKTYRIENGNGYNYSRQMFTDWETDNAKEMKMQYNGQDVELITKGYWPEGVRLISSDDGNHWLEKIVFFLRDGHAIFDGKEKGTCLTNYAYWAVLPAKPAPRRLTNREVANLCKKGWDTADGEWVYLHWHYKKEYENDPTPQGVRLRAPSSDEWLEPTSDLLEVGK